MGNGALPNGPSYRAHPRLYRTGSFGTTASMARIGATGPAVIPSIARRNPQIPHDCQAYRQRNLIERMFARLKDFRRVGTSYDKLGARRDSNSSPPDS